MADEETGHSHKEQPIIIKKIKKGGHGHHGGAWKVAYADFVTAMMAFFIVMWILAASNEATKKAITEYFSDPGAFNIISGEKIPIMKSDEINLIIKGAKGKGKDKGDGSGPSDIKEKVGWGVGMAGDAEDIEKYKDKAKIILVDSNDMKKLNKAKIDSIKHLKNVEKASKEIRKSIQEVLSGNPDIKEILSSIRIEMTSEGLRIELIESKDAMFFEVGSARIKPEAEKILKKIAEQISPLPNEVEIEGHTDSRQYGKNAAYTNWELSSDRANAARRVLMNYLWDGQITKVTGFADMRLRNQGNPFDISNRRVSILVKQMDTKKLISGQNSKTE